MRLIDLCTTQLESMKKKKKNLRVEPRFSLRGGTRGPSKPDSPALQGYLAHKNKHPPLGPP